MRQFLDKLYNLSGWAAGGFIAAICAVVILQVILNLIDRIASIMTGSAIGLTLPSYADFTGFFLAAASFLALAYTLKDGGHIRVSLVLQMLSKKAQRFFEIWCLFVASAIAVFFTIYTSFLVYESFAYNDLSPGIIPIPIWMPMMPMLIGLAIFATALVDDLFRVIYGHSPSYAGKGENLLEDDPASLHAE